MGKHFLDKHETPSSGSRFADKSSLTPCSYKGTREGLQSGHTQVAHRSQQARQSHADASTSKRRRKSSKLSLYISVAVLIVIVGAGVFFLQNKLNLRAQLEASRLLSEPVELEIPAGSSTGAIAQLLYDAHLIDSKEDFIDLLVKKGVDTKLKPGHYSFSSHDTSEHIIEQLLFGGKQEGLKLTIPEGYTIKQTAAQVEKQLGISQDSFLEEAKASNFSEYEFLAQAYADSLEGFLYPKTYHFSQNATAHEVIDTLLKQFKKETASFDFSSAQGLNMHQVITAASLIERETRVLEERPRIAGVIFNRLNKGMMLQIDASVIYALSTNATKLSLKDLEVDSEYNTYKHTGLPPGPICSPSASSIKAVLEPEKHNYLYYVLTSKDGTHSFSDNYQQFLEDKKEYKRVFSS